MTGDLRDALAADRAIRRRAAAEAVRVPQGLVLRHPELDDVHYLNALLLDAGAAPADADAIVALTDGWQGDLRHRHVVFDDERSGEELALALPGWERTRTCFMTFSKDPVAVAPDSRARPISEDEMGGLQLEGLRELAPEVDARSGLVARLAATQRALRDATPARCFGAGEPGEPLAANCTLFLDEDVNGRRVATVEEVGTLERRRGRGLARAVVLAAVAEAARWDADLIVVPADADDWPQLMYARLGFTPAGRQVALTRRLRQRVAGSDSVAGAL
jgi:GNAT superfamily N-acetyltransferase